MSYKNPEQHECYTCGYTWRTGSHGGHNCSVLLLERIASLKSESAEIQLERGTAIRLNAQKIGQLIEMKVENAKLNDDIRQMIEKAAAKHLPAYREQGQKLLRAEIIREAAQQIIIGSHKDASGFCSVDSRKLDNLKAALKGAE